MTMNRKTRRLIRAEFHRLLELVAREVVEIVEKAAPDMPRADQIDAAVDRVRECKIDGTDMIDKVETLIRMHSDTKNPE